MNQLLRGIIPAALALSLTACGAQGPEAFDPAADAETLLSGGAFTETLTPVEQATACLLYGLDESQVESCAVYCSTGATAEELAIFALKDDEAVQAAQEALEWRLEDRKEELKDYLPEEMPKLDGAVMETRDKTVLLAIANDYAPIEEFLKQ